MEKSDIWRNSGDCSENTYKSFDIFGDKVNDRAANTQQQYPKYIKKSTMYKIVALLCVVFAVILAGSLNLVYIMAKESKTCEVNMKVECPGFVTEEKQPYFANATPSTINLTERPTESNIIIPTGENKENVSSNIQDSTKSSTKSQPTGFSEDTTKEMLTLENTSREQVTQSVPARTTPETTFADIEITATVTTTTTTTAATTTDPRTTSVPATITTTAATTATATPTTTTIPATMTTTTATTTAPTSTAAVPTTTTATMTTTIGGVCTAPWIQYGSSCYRFEQSLSTWTSAKESCNQLGGYLVEIMDAAENNFLVATAANKSISGYIWIGLSDVSIEGTWVWENSQKTLSPSSYSNWASLQPDNGSDTEDCVHFFENSPYWNDDQCYNSHNYICERNI